jgi:hypothetical protein
VTKGWDRQEVRTLVAETINEIIEPLIYSEALELIDHHLAQGDEVWLVSMAPSEIVEPFAELLGITGAIASRAKIDEEGKFTGEMEFFAQGENKAVAMRELAQERGIDLSESFAYSDSETDIPDARGRRPRLRRQPRPHAHQIGPREGVADPGLLASGARARPFQVPHAVRHQRRSNRGRRRLGRTQLHRR